MDIDTIAILSVAGVATVAITFLIFFGPTPSSRIRGVHEVDARVTFD